MKISIVSRTTVSSFVFVLYMLNVIATSRVPRSVHRLLCSCARTALAFAASCGRYVTNPPVPSAPRADVNASRRRTGCRDKQRLAVRRARAHARTHMTGPNRRAPRRPSGRRSTCSSYRARTRPCPQCSHQSRRNTSGPSCRTSPGTRISPRTPSGASRTSAGTCARARRPA